MPKQSHAKADRQRELARRFKMGKKLEKGLKEKNQSAASQDTPDDQGSRTPEPYACTGQFQNDFTELCRRSGLTVIPPVIMRPRLPPSVTSHTPSEGKGEKGKKGQQQQQPEPDPEAELSEDKEPSEPPPKTYTTRPTFEYFKPCVQVDMENPDRLDTVTEVFIRGWKIDIIMMRTFEQCWPMMEKLHTVNLWNAGLTGETITSLASFLPHCANVRTLVLDGNTVKEENYHLLINDESLLQNLSLRHCGLTDVGAERLGKSLGTPQKYNLKLLSLNLTGNRITDVGVEHLAKGLRMNRALLSLSLANNQIGDKGACMLAEVLSRFVLTHEETVERRKLKSDSTSPERLKSPTNRRADSRDRPNSVRSNTHMDKSRRDKSSKKTKPEGKPGKEVKEETKGKKAEKDDKGGTKKGASLVADAGKTMSKTKDTKKKKEKSGTPQDSEVIDGPDHIMALTEPVDYIDGSLWISGNRVLINLNLSRNQIGETGMSAILKAIQYQTTLTQLESKSAGTGLMRVSLLKNALPNDHDILKKINELMGPKDPYYKATAKTPEEEPVVS
ncbi:leucine-rich repeat-containing protein 71-like isoform X2 [Liolophura sinensis]